MNNSQSDNSNSVICSGCRTKNSISARFCTNCGSTLGTLGQSPYQSPSSHQAPPMAADYIYAGFWKRAIAYIIDGIIFNLLFWIFLIFVLGVQFNFIQPEAMGESLLAAYGAYYFFWWMYYAILESSSGQATFGKRALGIKVADLDGNQLSFMHAAGRQLAGVVSAITFSIGYLITAFSGRKQALHDMIAGTVVVNKNFGKQQIQTVNMAPPAGMSAGGIIGVIFLVLIIPVGVIIAAIALPAYQDYTIRAKVDKGITHASAAKAPILEYAAEEGFWPSTFERIKLSSDDMQTDQYTIQLKGDGIIAITYKQPQQISQASLFLIPEMSDDGSYQWVCDGSEIKNVYLPSECRWD